METFLTTKLYSCSTELFEIELIIFIKMDLVLNNIQRLICHKDPTNQQTNQNQIQEESSTKKKGSQMSMHIHIYIVRERERERETEREKERER